MTDRIDAPTAPFTSTSHHALLATFAGTWTGTTEVWLDAAAPPEASRTEMTHTGSAMMMSNGAPRADGAVSLLGSYAAGDERWGWRTVLRREGDELLIEAFNISPAGLEEKAVATRFTRR